MNKKKKINRFNCPIERHSLQHIQPEKLLLAAGDSYKSQAIAIEIPDGLFNFERKLAFQTTFSIANNAIYNHLLNGFFVKNPIHR